MWLIYDKIIIFYVVSFRVIIWTFTREKFMLGSDLPNWELYLSNATASCGYKSCIGIKQLKNKMN